LRKGEAVPDFPFQLIGPPQRFPVLTRQRFVSHPINQGESLA
jgi:hypothetical protein